jgi:hypothetical protein
VRFIKIIDTYTLLNNSHAEILHYFMNLVIIFFISVGTYKIQFFVVENIHLDLLYNVYKYSQIYTPIRNTNYKMYCFKIQIKLSNYAKFENRRLIDLHKRCIVITV